MKSIYIAAPLEKLDKAREMAAFYTSMGYKVVSTWHTQDVSREKETAMSPQEKKRVANQCIAELEQADSIAVFLGKGLGHKFEFGYMLAKLKDKEQRALVHVYGDYEQDIMDTMNDKAATAMFALGVRYYYRGNQVIRDTTDIPSSSLMLYADGIVMECNLGITNKKPSMPPAHPSLRAIALSSSYHPQVVGKEQSHLI